MTTVTAISNHITKFQNMLFTYQNCQGCYKECFSDPTSFTHAIL